jgi:hypothetical protein
VDSILRFWLESGGDGAKHCRKMKWRQQARLASMGRKRDTTQQCDNLGQRKCSTGEGKGGDDVSWADANFTGPENKENPHGRFSCKESYWAGT